MACHRPLLIQERHSKYRFLFYVYLTFILLVGSAGIGGYLRFLSSASLRKLSASRIVDTSSPFRTPKRGSPILRYCSIREQYCLEPTEISGEWVLTENKTFHAPICCGWDGLDFLTKSKQCGTESQENRGMFQGRNDGFPVQIGGHACNCKNFTDGYTWKSPILDQFEARKTCQLLRNRKVIMLGDSTMVQTATTLINSLIPGGCQQQVMFVLSDTLVGKPLGNMNRGTTWRRAAERLKPDIMIFGAGAHIYDEDKFKSVFDTVVSEMMVFQKEQPNIRFVYKTQQPGGCTKEIAFPESPDEAAIKQNFHNYPYQHDKFYGRDLYAIAKLRQIGMPVIDMRMLYSRSDAHPSSFNWSPSLESFDCLHLCSPGPLDVIADLFQDLLQGI